MAGKLHEAPTDGSCEEHLRQARNLQREHVAAAQRLEVLKLEHGAGERFGVGAVHHHEAANLRGVAVSEDPSQGSSPVVREQVRFFEAEGGDQFMDVVGEGEGVVAVERLV